MSYVGEMALQRRAGGGEGKWQLQCSVETSERKKRVGRVFDRERK